MELRNSICGIVPAKMKPIKLLKIIQFIPMVNMHSLNDKS